MLFRSPFSWRAAFKAAALLFPLWTALSPAGSAQIESAGFPVVRLDESARVAAFGGRSPALATDDAAALYSNPAMLSSRTTGSISVSYLNHIGGVNAGWATYAGALDSSITFAGGIRYLSFGSIDRADERGVRDGTFSASDMALTLGASRAAGALQWASGRLSYGAGLNLLISTIDGFHSSALTFDAGVYYETGTGTTIGASMHHAGFVLSSFGRRRDRIPFDIRLGLSRRLQHMPLLVSITAYRLHAFDGGPGGTTAIGSALYHLILGGEFIFSESFRIRLGYNHRRHDELRMKSRLDMAGISFGMGIRLARVVVDYSFNSWSSLGGLHRFSVRTRL